MSYEKPFAGLKVIDLSQGVAGPYAAMMLGRYGADVIKVEPPEGDWSRTLGTKYGDQTAYSLLGNAGKRSIVLDLKTGAGKQVLWRLTETADIFIQGFRPGVIDRLGFGYDAVSARVPKVIYLSVSGFGTSGPLADRPAMDPVLQAYTGLAIDNIGGDGVPHRIPIVAIDMSTAIFSFSAISAALYARRDEPRGRHIEASLLQAAAGIQGIRMAAYHLEGGKSRPVTPPSGIWRTKDGFFSVTVVRPWEWVAFCTAMGRPELATDPRYANVELRLANTDTLRPIVRDLYAGMTNAELSERCSAHRVMNEQLNTYSEFLHQPHTQESGAIAWIDHPQVGVGKLPLPNVIGAEPFTNGPGANAPPLGAHTREILREHGYAEAEIQQLIGNAVATAP